MADDINTTERNENGVLIRRAILEPWPGPWAMWAKGFCAKNQWRVAHVVGEYEDCLAECALAFVECSLRYGKSVTTPQHMMALYKLSVVCWFNTLSVKDLSYRKIRQSIREEEPSVKSEAEVLSRLNEASTELKDVIRIIFSAPKEIIDIIKSKRPRIQEQHKQFLQGDSSISFFNAVLDYCKIPKTKSDALIEELNSILS